MDIRAARKWMAAASVVAPAVAFGQQIVHLDSVTDCRLRDTVGGIELSLPAGLYITMPVGPLHGGEFLAFNKWGGDVRGCDPSGYACGEGWVTQHDVRDAQAGRLGPSIDYNVVAETPEHALNMPARQLFRVCDGAVYITIYDSNCSDNVGGVSVRIDEACAADLNLDGLVDFFDFLEFQNLFAAGSVLADYDCDGDLTFFDFLAFQTAVSVGCL